MKKLRIGVVYGGISNEREISLMSGEEVINNIPSEKYEVIPIKISKKIYDNTLFKGLDCVFIALHGVYGEDGEIQSFLEECKVPFTGSSAQSSKNAFDKILASKILSEAGLLIPKTLMFGKDEVVKIKDKVERIIGTPCVVKPNKSGSSVGVSIVKDINNLGKSIKEAFNEDDQILIQEFIDGRELTCGVLGNDPLPPVEIRSKESFFNYKAKYFSDSTDEICPAPLTIKETKNIKFLSKLAHNSLNCKGLTRSDFILRDRNFYFIEINTLPGLTKNSLCPKEAKAHGITFPELLDTQIRIALE